MNIKIFSAKHLVKNDHDLQEIKKIEKQDFDSSLWVFASFKDASEKLNNIYKNIVRILEEHFFDDPNEDFFEKLEDTLKLINDKIKDDVKALPEGTFRDGGFVIALFFADTLYFTSAGTPEVYFIRKNKFSLISEGLSDFSETGDLFSNLANGELRDDDKLIFSSERLLRYATANQIASSATSGVIESTEALKFLIPEDESCFLSVHHIKKLDELPFEKNAELQGEGFFKQVKRQNDFGSGISKKIEDICSRFFPNSIPHKNIAIIFASLIALVLIAIFFGLISEHEQDGTKEVYRTEIEDLKKDLASIDLRIAENKKQEAGNLIIKIQSKANEINEKGYFRQEVMDILEEVQKKKDDLYGIMKMSGANVITDLQQSRENTKLKGVFGFGEDYFVYDFNALFSILAGNGEVKDIVNLTESEELVDGVAFDSKDEMLFLTNRGKIIEFKNGEKSFATTSDDKFKKSVALGTFSKYIYLLSPEDNQIWKYEKKGELFQSAQEYNSDADIKNAISMAIDGDIFVLDSEGILYKLHLGKKEDYPMKNAPFENLKGNTKVVTNQKLKYIYFLNPEEKAISKFYKGKNEFYYEGQIVIEDVDVISDIWIDPETEKLLFTDNKKLYEVKI